MAEEVVTLYRPTGQEGLELVTASGYQRWPPRLPEQPIFYLVANEEYAREIATRWNVPAGGVGFVTKSLVRNSFMDRYPVHQVGGRDHVEWWIPAEDLEELNDNIVGLIEVIGEFRQERANPYPAECSLRKTRQSNPLLGSFASKISRRGST